MSAGILAFVEGTDEVERRINAYEKETAGVWPIGTRWQPLTPPIDGKREDGMDQMEAIPVTLSGNKNRA